MSESRQRTFWKLLSPGLETTLRAANPWWSPEGIGPLPPVRRWTFGPVLRALKSGLAPAVVLRGPRQVGKTTILNHVADSLLEEGVPAHHLFRVQFDDLPDLKKLSMPIIDLCEWYAQAVLKASFRQIVSRDGPVYVLLDEVQNLADWAPQLKSLVDLNPVRVLVTGSSALRIEAGRDSLAGRITTIEMGPLLLREIAEFRRLGPIPAMLPENGVGPLRERSFWSELRDHGDRFAGPRAAAFATFSERGSYPISHARPDEPWERLADFLNETVVLRAIQHDLRMGPRGQKRDEQLLAEVFRLACRYVGQSPKQAMYVDELRSAMGANIGWQRILAYLKFLDGTLLIRLIEPLELRLKRKRGPAKLCLCDHALRAAWLREVVPLDPNALRAAPHLSDLAGRLAESTVGYFLRSLIGRDLAHFPERGAEPEVDYVLTIGEQRIPIGVKYRRSIDHRDTHGLRSFIEKAHYHAPFGVLVTQLDEPASDDPRIISIPLSTLMLIR